MNKIIISSILLIISHLVTAQINQAKVYWVGHSLISHTDNYTTETDNLINVLNTLAISQGKTYDYHQHTTPGAPLGWNWGANATAWSDIQPWIQPLINTSNSNYGTYDVMVLTEGINLFAVYEWWHSAFYARKFYTAAKNANPNTRLFLYESWHHYQASDDGFRDYYGDMASFNWQQYTLNSRTLWETIIDEASDPNLTPIDTEYTFQGSGTDPGVGNDILEINIIPTGEVLAEVLNRLEQNLASDNWSYNGSTLTALDFFANPLANFPTDLVTTIHADPVDDVHPTNVLIYLNALVHYAVIYQENPINLPAVNGVPTNIATIFKEVVWNIVLNNPRTGVTETLNTTDFNNEIKIKIYPNPASNQINITLSDAFNESTNIRIFDQTGKLVLSKQITENTLDTSISTKNITTGMYQITIQNKKQFKTYPFIKQ